MKKLFVLTIAFILCSLFVTNIYADEFKKVYQEKFNINADALLKTDTRYGDVVIKNWDENVISIVVVITVEKSSQKRATDFFEKIDISLKGNSSQVSAETSIDNLRGNNKFSIDYEIFAPKTISADITHKYGELWIDMIKGKTDITLKYGEMVVGSLPNIACNLNMQYVGEVEIGLLSDANIDVAYSEVNIDKAGFLNIESKYTEIDIEDVTKVIADSKYDEITIDNIDVLDIEGGFTEISIGTLKKKIIFDSNYGELEIDRLVSGFDLVDIESNYIDVSITVDSDASYQLYLNTSYGEFSIPEGNFNIERPSKTSDIVDGYVGSNPEASSKIRIIGNYFDVEIN